MAATAPISTQTYAPYAQQVLLWLHPVITLPGPPRDGNTGPTNAALDRALYTSFMG